MPASLRVVHGPAVGTELRANDPTKAAQGQQEPWEHRDLEKGSTPAAPALPNAYISFRDLLKLHGLRKATLSLPRWTQLQ